MSRIEITDLPSHPVGLNRLYIDRLMCEFAQKLSQIKTNDSLTDADIALATGLSEVFIKDVLQARRNLNAAAMSRIMFKLGYVLYLDIEPIP